jgi:hypothetical protein
MKQCKSCRKEIDSNATKCPYCQGYQQWFRNPQYLGFLFVIPFVAFMMWQTNLFKSEKFDDFKNNFKVEEVKIVQSDNNKYDIITYVISNNTDLKWTRIRYEVIGYDVNDKLVLSNAASEWAWIVHQHSQSYLSAKVERNKNVKKWKMKITDLETSRF